MSEEQEVILDKARQDWLLANDAAVAEAQKYLTKKGDFNPPLEKSWPKWEALRGVANNCWHVYYRAIRENYGFQTGRI